MKRYIFAEASFSNSNLEILVSACKIISHTKKVSAIFKGVMIQGEGDHYSMSIDDREINILIGTDLSLLSPSTDNEVFILRSDDTALFYEAREKIVREGISMILIEEHMERAGMPVGNDNRDKPCKGKRRAFKLYKEKQKINRFHINTKWPIDYESSKSPSNDSAMLKRDKIKQKIEAVLFAVFFIAFLAISIWAICQSFEYNRSLSLKEEYSKAFDLEMMRLCRTENVSESYKNTEIKALANVICRNLSKELGLDEDDCDITVEINGNDLREDTMAHYHTNGEKICVNPAVLYKSGDVFLETLAHEVHHHFANIICSGVLRKVKNGEIKPEQIYQPLRKWEEEIQDYKTSEKFGYEVYSHQSIEQAARKFGDSIRQRYSK